MKGTHIIGLLVSTAIVCGMLTTTVAMARTAHIYSGYTCEVVGAKKGYYLSYPCGLPIDSEPEGEFEWEEGSIVGAGKKIAFTGVNGAVKMTASTNLVTCTAGKSSGEIEGPTEVKKVKMFFTGCKGEETTTKKTCAVNSKGASTEEIQFATLEGKVGAVAKTEAATENGLNLRPVTGTTFSEIEGECLSVTKAAITGSVIGEIAPGVPPSDMISLNFKVSSAKQEIQKFEGGVKEVLMAFSTIEVPLETVEELIFAETINVH